jgi:hypothetical protein
MKNTHTHIHTKKGAQKERDWERERERERQTKPKTWSGTEGAKVELKKKDDCSQISCFLHKFDALFVVH